MNKQQFTKLVKAPTGLQSDLYKLHDLQAEYPYCQPIHVLVALANREMGTDHAGQTLNYAAMYVVDRANLKNLLIDPLGDPKQIEPKEIPSGKKEISKSEKPSKIESTPSEKNLPVKATEVLPAERKSEVPAKTNEKISFTSSSSSDGGEQLRNDLIRNLESLRLSKRKWNEGQAEPVDSSRLKSTKNAPAEKLVKPKKQSAKTPKKKATKAAGKKTTKVKKEASASKQEKKSAAKTKKPTGDKNKVKEQQELISKFIEISPSIKAKASNPPAVDPDQKDLSITSTSFSENLISENLAVIMVKQGKINKAIDIYKKLIWKYPQKKAYFAAQIEELNKSEG